MKVIVFMLVITVLVSLLVCLISLTKYLNFDRKIKESQVKDIEYWNYKAEKTKESKERENYLFIDANDKDTN